MEKFHCTKRQLYLENVDIWFHNFMGKKDARSVPGDSRFWAKLTSRQAKKLIKEGWNIKELRRKSDDKPFYMLPIKIRYREIIPDITLTMGDRGIVNIYEDNIGILDLVSISKASLCVVGVEIQNPATDEIITVAWLKSADIKALKSLNTKKILNFFGIKYDGGKIS